MRPEHWLFTIPLRLRSLFRWAQADQELDDELRDHVERRTEEYIAKGMTQEEARRRARIDLDGIEQTKEKCREARRVNSIQDLIQDLRFALRMLRKSAGFTTVAVLTIALGIGANTAIFSVVNGVLLRRLPYSDPDRLVWAAEYWPRINDDVVPDPDYANWKLNSRDFEGLAAFDSGDHMNMTGAGQPERIESVLVTANFVSVMGVGPSLGRGFLPREAEPGGKLVAILTDALWKRKFGAEQQILGKGIALNGQLYTGVGRNTGAGPGYASVDFHLAKRINFRRTEGGSGNAQTAGSSLEIAIDAFNAFNRTNFKNYVGTLTSPFFGRANAANPPRQVQVSTKYHF